MLYIGVDLGGTGIKAGLVDEQGKILSKASCPTGVERGYEAVIRDMAALCVKAVEEGGRSMDEVKAIGIGLPGIADPATKRVPFCTNLGWHDVPVEEEMHRYLDKPIYIDNDATVAGLAESVAGVSAGAKNSVFVTLGTGVGGGVIINGKVFSGTHGVASEIGHMIIVAKITAKTVIDLAKAGAPDAAELFDSYVQYLCYGLVNLINLYDPEIIALGGGVSGAGEFLLNAVRAKLPDLVFYKSMKYARIELARLGNDAGIIGAAMLGR
mgnify:CR=1 FL=1